MDDSITAKVLAALAQDLATELDLHYEDQALAGLTESMKILRSGVELLRTNDHHIPSACKHILRRYEKAGGV